jgi:hypothetical protein
MSSAVVCSDRTNNLDVQPVNASEAFHLGGLGGCPVDED